MRINGQNVVQRDGTLRIRRRHRNTRRQNRVWHVAARGHPTRRRRRLLHQISQLLDVVLGNAGQSTGATAHHTARTHQARRWHIHRRNDGQIRRSIRLRPVVVDEGAKGGHAARGAGRGRRLRVAAERRHVTVEAALHGRGQGDGTACSHRVGQRTTGLGGGGAIERGDAHQGVAARSRRRRRVAATEEGARVAHLRQIHLQVQVVLL